MVTPAVQRNAVTHLMDCHQMSERRACKAIGVCPMTIRYETSRSDDHDLRERMKALAHERRRFGYRRLHVLLRREGHLVNHKKLFRLYREEKLTVRKSGGRKRAIGTRAPMLVPMASNDRWSLDFVSDQFTDGRRFRVLTVVDDCTRECLGLVAAHPDCRAIKLDKTWGRGQFARSSITRINGYVIPCVAANAVPQKITSTRAAASGVASELFSERGVKCFPVEIPMKNLLYLLYLLFEMWLAL
ncbi:hypothetical protein RLEG12_00845 (plasmid) [Rhizobium leguminosarum bv. trifolii CB782]|nr:hypothetical protein RLEG12_00845 [Rhizobium leguminosarum bv. trifolii CB782]